MRPSPESSCAIARMSSSDSSKSNTWKFSSIRSGVTDFGITTLPSWMCQRRITCAGVRSWPERDPRDRLVVEQLTLTERAPGLGEDAVLGVLAPQLRLLEAGVQLDLVDRRRHAGGVDDRLDVLHAEVRDADRAGAPILLGLGEGLPGLDELAVGRPRPVDQIQIHVVHRRASAGSRPARAARCRGRGCHWRAWS